MSEIIETESEVVENNHKWYVINTVIGQERKIAKALNEDIEKHALHLLISEVIVPSEKVTEIKRGKKVDVEKKVCPGYLLVKMELNDRTLTVIRSIPGVAKLLGKDKKPAAIPESEVKRMLDYLSEVSILNTTVNSDFAYLPGDIIEIKEGAFEGFTACVETVDSEKKRITVSVSIFGRETPVDLDFKQAMKIHG